MRLCLLFALSLVPLQAAEPEAFVASLAKAPEIQAAQERIVANRRAAGATGRLPDPVLSAGYARSSSANARWPMYDATLEQPLPRWGARDALRARAAADIATTEAELQGVLGELAAELATSLAEAEAARATLVVIDGQIARATSVQATVIARLASGSAALAEQLSVTSKLAALQVEHGTLQRQVDDAEHDVRGRLGLAPTAPLPPFAAPEPSALTLARVPGVLAAQAQIAQADALLSEARATRYPETAVGVRYERELEPGNAMNSVGLEFRVSLPVWQGSADDLEEAARARSQAARRTATSWQYRAQALVSRAARATTVAASARAAAQATKARLDSEYAALIRSAATQNGGDLIAVLMVLDRLSEAERHVIEAETTARLAAASLWRVLPPDVAQVADERTQP